MENTELNQQVMDFFRTFTNLERLKIAGLLASEALTLAQAAERLGMRTKDAMNHLSMLEHFGYVKNQAGVYQIDRERITALSRQVLENDRPRSKSEDFEGEDFERKVLKDFFRPDGTLISMPSQLKKRRIVLAHIQQAFQPEVRYPEKEVNEILKRIDPDSASLRRYLVDEQLLAREAGIYWRM